MTYRLADLTIYPIKSVKGIPLQSSQVDESGLLGDRRYMIVNSNGEFVTGRDYPTLILIDSQLLHSNQWKLTHPDIQNSIVINPDDFSEKIKTVVIWDDELEAQEGKEEINTWFSHILNEPVSLVYFSTESKRFTSRRPESPVGFADGYPFLLTTQASLAELNETCPEHIDMSQFRSNLVVQGNTPFEEDTWKRIKIGEVEFENVKPCERCIFITVKPNSSERMKKGEPLKTLGKFRLLGKEGITFGVNLVALNTGTIHINDKVEILEFQEAYQYIDRRKKTQ